MKKTLQVIKEFLKTFLIALIIYLFISFFVKVGVVDGVSMQPTYQNGNYVVINRRVHNFNYNDIIAFNYGDTEDEYFEEVYNQVSNYNYVLHIKRILGLPGDEVTIKDGSLYINNEFKSKATINLEDQHYTLKDDEYFVQGDNINDSYDSRMHGPVKAEDIYGKIMRFRE